MAYLKWNALVITDVPSYTIKEAKDLIRNFKKENPDNKGLMKRTDNNYLNEWSVCAFCYLLGVMKKKAKDADMDFTIEPEVEFLYNILGPLSRLFLKLYHK